MKNTKKSLLFILYSGLFYWLAHSLTRPIVALYAQSLGVSEVEIGIIIGVYAVLPFLFAIPSGGIADSIGRVKVLQIGAIFMLLSGIFYMIATNIYLLIIGQIFAGLGQMVVWLVIQVLITAEKDNQSERIASFSVYNTIGQLLGPLIGGFLSEKYNMTFTFAVYTILSFLLILFTFQIKEQANILINNLPIKKMYKKSLDLLKNRGIVATLLCTFIVLFIIDVRITFLPIYLQEIGMSPFKIGILISLGAWSALLIKPIYPVLIRILGYKFLLVVTFIFSLNLLFLSPLLSNFFSYAVLFLFSGLALGINQPLSLSMISDQTTINDRGIAIGLRLMANRLSQLIDPLLFGIIAVIAGFKIAFFIIGFFLLLLSILTVILLQLEEKRQKTSSLQEKVF
jgi:MFS family permease